MEPQFWQLEHFGDNCALVDEFGRSVTYQQLAQRADDFAQKLSTRSLVLLQCHNSIESVAAYLGCLRHGQVPLLLGANLASELLTTIIERYQPDFIYAPCAQPKAGQTQSAESQAPSYELSARTTAQTQLHPDLALLLSTSGSTGSPKLVRLSAQNLQSNAQAIAHYLELTPKERPITSLPLNYSYGLSVMNSHLLVGATIVLTDLSVAQAQFWDLFNEQAVTSLAGVPYTYQMLKRLRFTKMKLPSLKTLTQAGGHLAPEIVQEIATAVAPHGVKFYVMYGQTEATARMSYVPLSQLPNKPGSIGIAIEGGKFTIEDEQGQEITTAHTSGALVYYGPNVNLGYATTKADLALGDVNQGRLITGDLAYFDEDHYFYLTGRRSRFIKLTGLRYSLNECEKILEQHGFTTICTGQDEHLCILLITDQDVSKQDQEEQVTRLKELVATTLHLHHKLFVIKSAAQSEIPRNEVGKIQYHELQQKFFAEAN